MYIIKVLKRKDASSVVVAIILAVILANLLPAYTSDLATYLSGVEAAGGTEWRTGVVRPTINAALQLVVLEALLRVTIFVRPLFVRKKK